MLVAWAPRKQSQPNVRAETGAGVRSQAAATVATSSLCLGRLSTTTMTTGGRPPARRARWKHHRWGSRPRAESTRPGSESTAESTAAMKSLAREREVEVWAWSQLLPHATQLWACRGYATVPAIPCGFGAPSRELRHVYRVSGRLWRLGLHKSASFAITCWR